MLRYHEGMPRPIFQAFFLSSVMTLLCLTSGCTQAERSQIGNWYQSTDAHVECYSGGKLIYSGDSTGKVISEMDEGELRATRDAVK